MSNLSLALTVSIAWVIPFGLYWWQSRTLQSLLLQEVSKFRTTLDQSAKELASMNRKLIDLHESYSQKQVEVQKDLLNRLAAHSWQEYVVLQEQTTSTQVENLVLDEDEEETQVVAELFDETLKAAWNDD